MKHNYNYIIIGGGISGLSIAYHLAKKGAKDILVLEKDALGSGSTGRCGAGVRTQWSTARNCLLAKLSVEFYEKANQILDYAGDVEFHQGGYLIVAGTEQEATRFKTNVELQNSLGIPSEYLSPQQAKAMMPHIDETQIYAATFCKKDGHLNPFTTTEAFALAAQREGVTIAKFQEVTDIIVEEQQIKGVMIGSVKIAAPIVVNAAGGYSKSVGQMAGIDLPVTSVRHQILATEPLESIQDAMYMSFSKNIYVQQVPQGAFIMGRGDDSEPTDYNVKSSWQFLEKMSQTATTLLPILKNMNVVRQWAGLYNMTPDAHPIYGKVDGLNGYYQAIGFSGHGFMLAPATGLLMSEMILNQPLTIDISDLNLDRFKKGELQRESSVV